MAARKVSVHKELVEALREMTAPMSERPKAHPVARAVKEEENCKRR